MAAILGAFDDKIELNRRLSQTLEATAQALPPCAGPGPLDGCAREPDRIGISALLRERCSLGSAQSHSLAALRDALLPELLSGRIRTPDVGGET